MRSTPLILLLFSALVSRPSLVEAQSPRPLDVEWYQPEVERGRVSGLATVIISGRTAPDMTVSIDGKNITVIKGASKLAARHNCRLMATPGSKGKMEGSVRRGSKVDVLEESGNWLKVSDGGKVGYVSKSCFGSNLMNVNYGGDKQNLTSPKTRSNSEGYFELAVHQPPGLTQIPIVVSSEKGESKTYLITFDISLENVRMNTKVSKNKPPAAAKHLRVWLGVGSTYQSYRQTVAGKNVSFVNMDSPSLLGRLGYWGDSWGLDLFLRDAPGRVDSASDPFTIESGKYHWLTAEVRGMYQVPRDSGSRLFGLPSQWQLFFGGQHHQMPFLDIDGLNNASIRKHTLLTATMGLGLLLAQERPWSYELLVDYQLPVSAAGEGGDEFSVSSPLAVDARLGATYKFATNWRFGAFIYTQSHTYKFKYTNKALGSSTSGNQNLFYSTFDLHLGYEY